MHARCLGRASPEVSVIGRWLSGCLALGAILGVLTGVRPEMASPLSAQVAAPSVVAIRNATIITATRGTIANGTMLVRDGKIAAVGTNVPIPAGRRRLRRHRQVRLARHHRRALAHRQRRHQRRQRVGQLDDRHGRRARPDRHQHLSRPRRRHDHRRTSCTAAPTRSAARPSSSSCAGARPGASDLVFQGALPGIKFALGENVTRKRGQARDQPAALPDARGRASST